MNNSRCTAVKNSATAAIEFLIWLIGASNCGLKLMRPQGPNKHASAQSVVLVISGLRNSQSSCNLIIGARHRTVGRQLILFESRSLLSPRRKKKHFSPSEWVRTYTPTHERWCAASWTGCGLGTKWSAEISEGVSESKVFDFSSRRYIFQYWYILHFPIRLVQFVQGVCALPSWNFIAPWRRLDSINCTLRSNKNSCVSLLAAHIFIVFLSSSVHTSEFMQCNSCMQLHQLELEKGNPDSWQKRFSAHSSYKNVWFQQNFSLHFAAAAINCIALPEADARGTVYCDFTATAVRWNKVYAASLIANHKSTFSISFTEKYCFEIDWKYKERSSC